MRTWAVWMLIPLLTAVGPSGAQTAAHRAAPSASMPTDTAIEREIRQLEPQRRALFGEPLPAAPAGAFPQIATPSPSGMDVQEVARRYEQRAVARQTEDLLIFASFSMPPESLRRLVRQASQVGASVVLRGLKGNSLKETAAAIQALGEGTGHVIVHPKAFTQYKIEAVPAVVLARPESGQQLDAQGCALPGTYTSIAGDVSLPYALKVLHQKAPDFRAQAMRYLRQLGESP